MLLQACPAISGVTFRIHGESGVEEGSYDFWKTVFDGVATCGRKVEIDMHAKGMDQAMIDMALGHRAARRRSRPSSGPSTWACRTTRPIFAKSEQPKAGRTPTGLMKFSAGSRSFLRYGYGDLLREDRQWGVVHRIWPGTQRLLLWGDPLTAAAYARAFSFCGSDGVEICEPLSFKGRRGSGIAGDRCAYADASLRTALGLAEIRVHLPRLGPLALQSRMPPPILAARSSQRLRPRRARRRKLALANASRILPIVTTAHCPSAANNTYWPEMYTNQSIVEPREGEPYTDTPSPRVFGNVSPLDPQLFSRMNDFADALLAGHRDAKYSPVEVAQWLEVCAHQASSHLAKAGKHDDSPAFRRMAIDVEIQAGLGLFFAAKFRTAVLYRVHETGDLSALKEALLQYRRARGLWADMSHGPGKAYVHDITVGEHPWLRGHWLDRLAEIDPDIDHMASKLVSAESGTPEPRIETAIQEALGSSPRAVISCQHKTPASFKPGRSLDIELTGPAGARLFYRHVDQAERWVSIAMEARDQNHRATIPAAYTNSDFPLQYYFEVTKGRDVTLYPGFAPQLNNQPYYTIRQA